MLAKIKKRFHSRLCCHARVEPFFDKTIAADVYFDAPKQKFYSGNIKIIPTLATLIVTFSFSIDHLMGSGISLRETRSIRIKDPGIL